MIIGKILNHIYFLKRKIMQRETRQIENISNINKDKKHQEKCQ
jgi:hypothetical protein